MDVLAQLGFWFGVGGGLSGLAAAIFVIYTMPSKRGKIQEEARKAASEAAKAAAEAEVTAISGFRELIESQVKAHGEELERMDRRHEESEKELIECKRDRATLHEKVEILEREIDELRRQTDSLESRLRGGDR